MHPMWLFKSSSIVKKMLHEVGLTVTCAKNARESKSNSIANQCTGCE